ncbi:MAG: hypothetical protein JO359_10020 [Candidatus Eremiobacteraeota bacterium]|nr:hypothetical protein [Candidatus Eremiobacteraeota bacterium]
MGVLLQRYLVVGLSCVLVVLLVPAALQGWGTHGSYGMRILRAENLIRSVEPGSPADRAGIIPGDRADLTDLGIPGHLRLMNPRAGDALTLDILHGSEERTVRLVAVAEPMPVNLRWLILASFVSTFAFIAVGTILVFMRPAPMTWWLWLYCAGILPLNETLDYYAFLPDAIFAPLWLFGRTFLGGLSVFPIIPFALRFPHDRIEGWRARARPAIGALAVVSLIYFATIAWKGLRYGLDHYSLLNGIPALFYYLVASLFILATYLSAHGVARQRLKWAVTGMLIAFVAQIPEYFPGPAWVAPLSLTISIVMPLSVAYAALRHNLIDVQFVLSRALVVGALTAILIAFVSLVDWLTSRFISEYHFALYLEASATIAMGFVLDRLHASLERLAERVVFRHRLEAEEHLALVARSLSFANHRESIDEALTEEPARALRLASAAVFYRDGDRPIFVRGRSVGWDESELKQFPDDAPVVRYLTADRKVLRAKDAAWKAESLPKGSCAPVLFVPVFCRGELLALGVYGAHLNGTTLDPGEVTMLAQLAPGAGVALDHLAFERLRERLERTEDELRAERFKTGAK